SDVLEDLGYYRSHRAIVEELLRCRRPTGRLPPCYVAGPEGAGMGLIAETLAAAIGKDLLRVRASRLSAAAAASGDFGGLLAREAQLRHCLVLLDGIDEALGEGERDRVRAGTIESLLHALSGCDVITSGTMPPAELRHRLHARPLGFELTYPGQGERLEIWRR